MAPRACAFSSVSCSFELFCAIVAELALKLTDALHQGTLTIFEVAYVQSRASSNIIL